MYDVWALFPKGAKEVVDTHMRRVDETEAD